VNTILRKVSISPIDIQIITVVGDNATALRSTNSETTFNRLNLGALNQRNLVDVEFKYGSNLVFSLGKDGYLLKSSNTGGSYVQALAGIRNNFTGTDFKSDRVGLISGVKVRFFLTTNVAVSLINRPLPEPVDQVRLDFWNTLNWVCFRCSRKNISYGKQRVELGSRTCTNYPNSKRLLPFCTFSGVHSWKQWLYRQIV
jgi:hypothetical protein